MTIDEAIEHANQVADSYKDTAPACKCAHEHRQLAEWLTELKILRTENTELRDALKHREWIARMLGELTARVVNLQELVRDLYEMAYPEYPSAFEAAFADRLRELGVETNDV